MPTQSFGKHIHQWMLSSTSIALTCRPAPAFSVQGMLSSTRLSLTAGQHKISLICLPKCGCVPFECMLSKHIPALAGEGTGAAVQVPGGVAG